MAGLVIGVTRMGLEFSYSVPSCGSGEQDLRPPVLYNVHYLNFAIILAACTFIVVVAISLVTQPRRDKQVGSWLKYVTGYRLVITGYGSANSPNTCYVSVNTCLNLKQRIYGATTAQ